MNFCLVNPCPLQTMHDYILQMHNKLNLIDEKIDFKQNIEKESYFNSLKNKIKQIEENADSSLLLSYDPELIIKEAKKNLFQIEKKNWPFQFFQLYEELYFLNEKIQLIRNKFSDIISENEGLKLTDFQSLLLKSVEILKIEIKNSENIIIIDEIFTNHRKKIKELFKVVKLQIDFYFVINTKNKINERIEESSSLIHLEEEKGELEVIIEDFKREFPLLNESTSRKLLIEKTLYNIHKIHTAIEKKITQKEIYESYKEFTSTVDKFNDKKLRISNEVNYVTDVLEDSDQIISNIAKNPSPFGLTPISQLEITKEGMQRTINYALKSIYEKIGRQEIEKLIDQLPFSNRLDHGMLSEIKEHAKEELSNKCCHSLSEKNRKECLHNLCKNIYLIYAELCIRKSIRFIFLIKHFENFSEEEKKALEDKTEIIILRMKAKIETLFQNKNIHSFSESTHNHTTGFDNMIDMIISECNIELRKT